MADIRTEPPAGQAADRKPWKKGQELACKECSRMKIKCSRVPWPCESCVRRGCAEICPTGSLPYKLPLAKRQRTDAARSSQESPPLDLMPDLSTNSHAMQGQGSSQEAGSSREWPSSRMTELLDAVADASVHPLLGPGANSPFVGRGAGAALFLEDQSSDWQPVTLQYPFCSPAHASVHSALGLLPSYSESLRLLEVYDARVTWMYRTTTTQDARADLSATQQPNRKLDAHRIAALFAVLALGLLFDDDSSTIVHHLRQDKAICLFNAASSLLTLPENHFLPSPSIAAVETLHNQVSFCFCVGLEQASKSGWTLLGLALRVAQAIGLQRDPIRLGLVGEAAEHRRRVWWEVSTYEMLQSLNFGRPNSLPRSIDCPMPDTQGLFPAEDRSRLAFHFVKYELGILFGKVSAALSAADLPLYDTVTMLDAELRAAEARVPEHLRLPDLYDIATLQQLPGALYATPQQHMISLLLHKALLALHRPYFAKALQAAPEPMFSPYSGSFNACIMSARRHTQLLMSMQAFSPLLASKWWFFLFHTITSAVVQASVLLAAPQCMVSVAVRNDFKASLQAITTMAPSSSLARRACPVLNQLQRQIDGSQGGTAPFARPEPQGQSEFTSPYGNLDLTAQLLNDPASLISEVPPSDLQQIADHESLDPFLRTLLHWNSSGIMEEWNQLRG